MWHGPTDVLFREGITLPNLILLYRSIYYYTRTFLGRANVAHRVVFYGIFVNSLFNSRGN